MIKSSQQKCAFFGFLTTLTACFIFVQICFFVLNNYKILHSTYLIKQQIQVPLVATLGLLACFGAHLLLYAALTIVIWIVTKLIAQLFQLRANTTINLATGIWCLGVCTIMLANQVYWPNSLFAKLISEIFPSQFSAWLLNILYFALALLIALALYQIATFMIKTIYRTIALIILFFILFNLSIHHNNLTPITRINSQKPNVIILGIDSLRPDHLGFMGSQEQLTPKLDNFLSRTTYFTNTTTPLARTFSAWVSMLTGLNPHLNGATNDLIPPDQINLQQTLAKELSQQGYETIFALDDTHFCVIDQHYGFQHSLGPAIGFNNLILSDINDFPLSNLVMNTVIGKWLFPYNYANRQSTVHYEPSTFNHVIASLLDKTAHRPLFLIVHFCLPHYPYGWSRPEPVEIPPADTHAAHILYNDALRGADQQFGDMINILKNHHLLDHAIVVVLSDHGEALGSGERITTPQHYVIDPKNPTPLLKNLLTARGFPQALDVSTGHGTDLLSPNQYHVMLGFRTFGMAPNRIAKITWPSSLVDLSPTLLSLLHLPAWTHSEGISLAPFIEGKPVNLPTRQFYMEDGFTPVALNTTHISLNDLLIESWHYFYVDPKTGIMVMRSDMHDQLLDNKQYALLRAPWILALYPTGHQNLIGIIANLQTGQWTDHLDSTYAKSTPAASMLQQLKLYYGQEIHYPLLP